MACSYKHPYKPEKLFSGEKSELKHAGVMQRVYYVYDLPPCIVTAYAWALQKEFWEVWFSLEITGYEDIETREKKEVRKEAAKEAEEKEPEKKKRIFYEAILRDSEDEFLEFWDMQDLYLSNSMQMNLEEWEGLYVKIDEAEVRNMDGEVYLADILWEMETIWDCRYADKEMVMVSWEGESMGTFGGYTGSMSIIILRMTHGRVRDIRVRAPTFFAEKSAEESFVM